MSPFLFKSKDVVKDKGQQEFVLSRNKKCTNFNTKMFLEFSNGKRFKNERTIHLQKRRFYYF